MNIKQEVSDRGPWLRVTELVPENTGPRRITRIAWQDGPVKEYGVNGAQVDDVIGACLNFIEMVNESWPCDENLVAMTYLRDTLTILEKRRQRRMAEGVEGTSQK